VHRLRLDGGQYRIDIALAASRQQREGETAPA
jgi:hypothetical protein